LEEEEAIFGRDSLSMDDDRLRDRLRETEHVSALMKQDEEQRQAKRTKWLWNSLKPKRTSVIDERERSRRNRIRRLRLPIASFTDDNCGCLLI